MAPAKRMESSTILTFPEWLIQLFSYWIRPFDPKGLPCRGREASLHSQKHWYASLQFHSHKTKISFDLSFLSSFLPFSTSLTWAGSFHTSVCVCFHIQGKNKRVFFLLYLPDRKAVLTRYWEGLQCEICNRMREGLWMSVNHPIYSRLDMFYEWLCSLYRLF